MINNKKDFIFRAIALQTAFCLLLFGFFYLLKKNNSGLFSEIEKSFSKSLSENITVDEVEDVFNSFSDGVINRQAEKIDDLDAEKTEDENKENDKNTFSNKSGENNIAKESTVTTASVEGLLESQTEFVPFDEPSLSATVEATGGLDYEIAAETDVPDNVSVSTYSLTKNMINPVIDGKITSDFGSRIHPITNQLTFHAGIDIASDKGAPIYAAFDGKVIVSDYDKWNGNYLKIQHEDGVMTVYCHCDKLNVRKGDVIRAGEVVGYVGSTGSSTGPHLHFELRIDNVSYNPQIALREAYNAF